MIGQSTTSCSSRAVFARHDVVISRIRKIRKIRNSSVLSL